MFYTFLQGRNFYRATYRAELGWANFQRYKLGFLKTRNLKAVQARNKTNAPLQLHDFRVVHGIVHVHPLVEVWECRVPGAVIVAMLSPHGEPSTKPELGDSAGDTLKWIVLRHSQEQTSRDSGQEQGKQRLPLREQMPALSLFAFLAGHSGIPRGRKGNQDVAKGKGRTVTTKANTVQK